MGKRLLPSRSKAQPTAAALLSGFLFVSVIFGADPDPPVRVRNFGEVESGLYRGAEPTPLGMQDLQRRGVRLIIDLRESGTATLREGDQARQLQMQYVNVPLPPFSAPAKDDVSRVLVLLAQRGEVPVFVHCRRGKDRTGTVIACYRMQRDGWDRAQAMAEAERYGMSWTERGMRSFIRHFSPLAPATLPGGSAPVAVQP